jgi:tRNA(Arg) A34 adenosine deaminase TadA
VSTAPSSVAQSTPAPATPLASHPTQPVVELPTSKNQNLRPITPEQIFQALSSALALLSTSSQQHDKRPFSALLLAPDNTTTLLTHFSISHVRHAECELARLASDHFSTTYLASCTLVSTWEPCAMCSGTIYWSGIGRVIYAAAEDKLKQLTGDNNDENLTMSLPCRTVLNAGQRDIEVLGPIAEWESKVLQECSIWWKQHGGKDGISKAPSVRSNGTSRSGHGTGERMSVVTTWTHEDAVLSSIGEDGEYKADLDIDWMR